MIPPVPLAPGEFRGSIVASYDFNRFAPATSLGINFYWGAGKDCNLGFGYQPPLGISHFTAVKYFNSKNPNHENAYVNINGIFLATDYSPDLEIGASYIINNARSYNSISSGLWLLFDRDTAMPFWRMILLGAHFNPRPGPFIRYEFSHDDFSLSIRNDLGLSKRAVEWNRRRLEEKEKIVIPNSDINYITFDANSKEMQIDLNDSIDYRITRNYPGADAWFRDIERNRLEVFTDPDSIDYYRVVTLRPDPRLPANRLIEKAELYELNFDAILSDYVGKKDIVISSYPERTEGILRNIHWYKHDWSIAIGSSWGKPR